MKLFLIISLVIISIVAGLVWFNLWGFNPIWKVVDRPLVISEDTIQKLEAYKAAPKFVELPGVNNEAELKRLNDIYSNLLDTVTSGIRANPSKLWVMKQFQNALKATREEDTEAQEHFGIELQKLMSILGIDSSDGLISFYRYGYLLTYVLLPASQKTAKH